MGGRDEKGNKEEEEQEKERGNGKITAPEMERQRRKVSVQIRNAAAESGDMGRGLFECRSTGPDPAVFEGKKSSCGPNHKTRPFHVSPTRLKPFLLK